MARPHHCYSPVGDRPGAGRLSAARHRSDVRVAGPIQPSLPRPTIATAAAVCGAGHRKSPAARVPDGVALGLSWRRATERWALAIVLSIGCKLSGVACTRQQGFQHRLLPIRVRELQNRVAPSRSRAGPDAGQWTASASVAWGTWRCGSGPAAAALVGLDRRTITHPLLPRSWAGVRWACWHGDDDATGRHGLGRHGMTDADLWRRVRPLQPPNPGNIRSRVRHYRDVAPTRAVHRGRAVRAALRPRRGRSTVAAARRRFAVAALSIKHVVPRFEQQCLLIVMRGLPMTDALQWSSPLAVFQGSFGRERTIGEMPHRKPNGGGLINELRQLR